MDTDGKGTDTSKINGTNIESAEMLKMLHVAIERIHGRLCLCGGMCLHMCFHRNVWRVFSMEVRSSMSATTYRCTLGPCRATETMESHQRVHRNP